MKKYGFGIVGSGMIAEFHAKALQDIPQAKLVAFTDKIPDLAKRKAEQFGCASTSTLDELLALDSVEVVCVCTPSGTHAEAAIPAAQAGKHVIVEKPIEVTLEKVDAIIDACDQAGVKLAGIFPSRFVACNKLVKEAVHEGRFGKLTLGSAYIKWYRSQEYYDKGGWKGTWALDGGGALMNQSIHAVDLLQWFMGEVDRVQAFMDTLVHERIEVEDTAVACIRFKNGAVGVIEGATSVFPGFFKRIEICGFQGTAIVEEETLKCWRFTDETERDKDLRQIHDNATETGGGASDPGAIDFANHKAQIEDMLKAIELDENPLVDGREARKSVEIILAIYRSAREERPIALPLSE